MDWAARIEQWASEAPARGIPWEEAENCLAASGFPDLRHALQNPAYHGEGDAYAHTRMVCEALVENPSFQQLPGRQKAEVFLAALLHDLGKVKTTRLEEGGWVSPHHAFAGSQLAREFLFGHWGLGGNPDTMVFRETVCALIRWHMLPVRLMEQEAPERRARQTAAIGELAWDFSWKLLCMLSQADIKGRIALDVSQGLERVELAAMLAQEAGCFQGPYPFGDGFTRRAYLGGRNVQPSQTLYDDTWGEVILLSGLPGTGKDTWMRRRCPDMPAVSLDAIRRELGIGPTDGQEKVLEAAKERAREHLRKKQPFIWNATNLTKDTRGKLISLFERYGAGVRVVYLETGWEERTRRNAGRRDRVPESAVGKMLGKMTPPTPDEARTVEWICV